jgi:hypothetical protein
MSYIYICHIHMASVAIWLIDVFASVREARFRGALQVVVAHAEKMCREGEGR